MSKSKLVLLACTAVLSLLCINAHAWTVTMRGTINSGYDSTGVFGSVDQDLSGLTFVQEITANTDMSQWSYNNSNIYENSVYGTGPAFTFTVTVNGHSTTFVVLNSLWGQQYLARGVSAGYPYANYDYIYNYQYGYTADDNYAYALNYAFSYSTGFVPTLNFDQILTQNFDSSFGAGADFAIIGTQNARFYGTPNFIAVNNQVPEPDALALFGLGALGLIASRRKSATSTSAKQGRQK